MDEKQIEEFVRLHMRDLTGPQNRLTLTHEIASQCDGHDLKGAIERAVIKQALRQNLVLYTT